MDTGFGNNLEGFIIRGNLSLEPTDTPLISGNGSLEAYGGLYIDSISAYSNNSQGVSVSGVILNDGGIYTPNSLASTGFTSASIITNGGMSIRNTTNVIGTSAGGALTVYGGTSLVKDVIIGGSLDMTGGTISNVSWPYSDYDAVPKIYVDSLSGGNGGLSGNFTTGQVIIGESTGTSVQGFGSLTFINDVLTLGTGASIVVSSTNSNAFTVYGGGSFDGNLSMSDNRITLLDPPIDGKDAVNKDFLESSILSLINFTTGQVLVGGNNGTTPSIYSYNTFTFPSSNGPLVVTPDTLLQNTTIGGYLNTATSATIGGVLSMSDNRIVSLDPPISLKDAVNKEYLLNYLHDCDVFGEPEDEFATILESSDAFDIQGLVFGPESKAFTLYLYITESPSGLTSLFTLKGLYDEATLEWVMISEHSGSPMPFIQFNITPEGQIQYKNASPYEYYLTYWIPSNVKTTDMSYTVTGISNNINTPTTTGISFPNAQFYGFDISVIVRTSIGYSLHLITGLQENGVWTSNIVYFGNPSASGVTFSVDTNGNLMYTNSATSGSSTITVTTLRDIPTGTLESLVPTVTPQQVSPQLIFDSGDTASADVLVYIQNTDVDKFSIYKINAKFLQDTGQWSITSLYIGDNIIQFNITDIGVLEYTQSQGQNLLIKFATDSYNLIDGISSIVKSSNASDIPDLLFDLSCKAFIESVYLRQLPSGLTARFILKGLYDEDSSEWVMTTEHTGTPMPFIQFNITPAGQIQYKNASHYQYYTKYWNLWSIKTTDPLYTVTSISNNVNTPTATGITYSGMVALRTGIVTRTDIGYTLHLITALQENGVWVFNTVFIGDPQSSGVVFSLDTNGDLLYTNSSVSGSSTFTNLNISIVETGSFESLVPSVLPQPVSTGLIFNSDEYTTMNILLYVKNTDNDKFTLHDINGEYLQDTSQWYMTSAYMGDNIIQFSITPSGVLQYTHSQGQNLLIRFTVDAPVHVHGLCVTKGGTGRNDFLPGTILRGDGQESLIATTELMFYNDALMISTTRDNSITTNGGIVCEKLEISGQNVKIPHPIESVTQYLLNNQGSPVNIPDAIFESPCVIYIAITISTITTEYNTIFHLEYMQSPNSYFLDVSQKGDISSMTFDILPSGQLRYTSSNTPNWVSSEAKFAVITF